MTFIAAVVGTIALVALLVLPGFRIAERLAFPVARGAIVCALAMAASVILLVAVAVPLLAMGWFSPLLIALIAVVLAAIGMPPFARWLRATGFSLASVAWFVALAIPWALLAVRPGYPPADKLQWYYANVAGQLGATGGIPQGVAEWGALVRWLPDYLAYDVVSQAYTGLLSWIPTADAISAWRIAVAALSAVALFVVLRLWVGRGPAALGTALLAGTTFFVSKFNAYKPEALGILLGLVALYLVVRGIRSGRRSWILVAGALLGLDLSVHAIAAVALGLATMGFGAAEWATSRHPRIGIADALVRAAILGVVLSVALGAALQGRATVATQATTPTETAAGDPTWTFFLRSTGNFSSPEPAPVERPLAAGVTSPWEGFRVVSAFGWWLPVTIVIGGFFLVAFGGRRARGGAFGLVATALLLVVVIGFFALAFSTYVPRWTGLVRFGQYTPLIAGVGVAFAMEGYLHAWSRLAERRIPRLLPATAALAGLVWLLPWTAARYADELQIAPSGLEALAKLRSLSNSGDVVVSNVLTSGTIESFTGREVPLEGRQPLIEDAAFLARANALLLDAHRWFGAPTDRGFVDTLGARWVLIADNASTLGAPTTVGGAVALLRDVPWLRPAWTGDGIALFEVTEPAAAAAVKDRLAPSPLALRTAVVGLVFAVVTILLVGPRGVVRAVRGRATRRQRHAVPDRARANAEPRTPGA
jgi:hypothetical protein